MSATKKKPFYFDQIKTDSLDDTAKAILGVILHKIITPMISNGWLARPEAANDTVIVEVVVNDVLKSINTYVPFLQAVTDFPYCAQLTLETLIEVLRDHHDAPDLLLDTLQAAV